MWVRENSLIFLLISILKDSKPELFLLTVVYLHKCAEDFGLKICVFTGWWLIGRKYKWTECLLHNKMRHLLPFNHNRNNRHQHAHATSGASFPQHFSRSTTFAVQRFCSQCSCCLWFRDILGFLWDCHLLQRSSTLPVCLESGRVFCPTGETSALLNSCLVGQKTRLDYWLTRSIITAIPAALLCSLSPVGAYVEAAKWWRGQRRTDWIRPLQPFC